jgi:hypothetical protein
VPYDLLKPVLLHATPDQLFLLEHYNPYLIEETGELWQFHCQREFRTKQRQDMETAREMYLVSLRAKMFQFGMRAQKYSSTVYVKNYLLEQFGAYLHSDLLTNYVVHTFVLFLLFISDSSMFSCVNLLMSGVKFRPLSDRNC